MPFPKPTKSSIGSSTSFLITIFSFSMSNVTFSPTLMSSNCLRRFGIVTCPFFVTVHVSIQSPIVLPFGILKVCENVKSSKICNIFIMRINNFIGVRDECTTSNCHTFIYNRLLHISLYFTENKNHH